MVSVLIETTPARGHCTRAEGRKTMKKIAYTIAAIVAAAALILGNNLILSACSDSFVNGWRSGFAAAEDKTDPARMYPACGVVVRLDYDTDTVTVEDVTGHEWQFYGCEDWCLGDVAALLMYDWGTVSILDDEIMIAHYAGTVDMLDDITFTIAY